MKAVVLIVLCGAAMAVAACSKTGVGGAISQTFGDWAVVRLPAGCVAKQIAAEEGNGVAVLCEDGRVFH